jgi:transcriptional regulator GlxA family with amidase domain
MLDNLHRKLPLGEGANSVNLSVCRLCCLFKSATGMSAHQYLRLLRMERARNLLETSFMSVREITRQVGVSDESHFRGTSRRRMAPRQLGIGTCARRRALNEPTTYWQQVPLTNSKKR